MARQATLEELSHVEMSRHEHVYCPAQDVDLEADRIQHPEMYPFVVRPADKVASTKV